MRDNASPGRRHNPLARPAPLPRPGSTPLTRCRAPVLCAPRAPCAARAACRAAGEPLWRRSKGTAGGVGGGEGRGGCRWVGGGRRGGGAGSEGLCMVHGGGRWAAHGSRMHGTCSGHAPGPLDSQPPAPPNDAAHPLHHVQHAPRLEVGGKVALRLVLQLQVVEHACGRGGGDGGGANVCGRRVRGGGGVVVPWLCPRPCFAPCGGGGWQCRFRQATCSFPSPYPRCAGPSPTHPPMARRSTQGSATRSHASSIGSLLALVAVG